MSAIIARVFDSLKAKSLYPGMYDDAEDVDPLDSSLSRGDLKDSLIVEFHGVKSSLEEIAQALDEAELWGEGAKLRAIAKDL